MSEVVPPVPGHAFAAAGPVAASAEPGQPAPVPAPRPRAVTVEQARARLAFALEDLDDALSVKGSIERHPVAWAVGGGVAVLTVAGALVWAFRRK